MHFRRLYVACLTLKLEKWGRATLLYCFILLKSQSWVVHLGGVESMSSSCSWQTGLLILLFAHVECLCFQVLVFKFIMSLKVGTTNQWIEVLHFISAKNCWFLSSFCQWTGWELFENIFVITLGLTNFIAVKNIWKWQIWNAW